jgi:hypothetical protein
VNCDSFFDPTPEQQSGVLVDAATLCESERLIESCEHCNPSAEIQFDRVLDRITCSDSATTDYILEQLAKWRNCRREIIERTIVEAHRVIFLGKREQLHTIGVYYSRKKQVLSSRRV